jgi:hypothetical protein
LPSAPAQSSPRRAGGRRPQPSGVGPAAGNAASGRRPTRT